MTSANSKRILVGGGWRLGESLTAANVQQMDMQSVFIAALDSFNNYAKQRRLTRQINIKLEVHLFYT